MMIRIFKWAGILLAGVVIAAGVFAGVQWYRASSVPAFYEGDVTVSGVSAPVRIVRDENAVPHIYGETELDVLFGLGFAHAQDRFWQMDLTRRRAQGRVSEILGQPALSGDIFSRSLNFAANVQESWAAMAPEDRERLEAYAAGVNAWLSSDAFRLPAEYILTMTRPEPWTPQDSLFIWKGVWLTFGTRGREFNRARLERRGGPALAEGFYRPYPEDGHVAMAWPDLARTLDLPEMAGTEETVSGGPAGPAVDADPANRNSNNWVVAGSRSASGSPMLANDPHLGYSMPGFWYLAHLDFPGNPVVIASVPGLPGIGIGRNAHMAWGITNNRSDIMDLYLEPIDPDDANRYRAPGGPSEFETRTEKFKVRFGGTVSREFRMSRHGPIIPSDLFSSPITDDDKYAVAVSWTALDQVDRSLSSLMAMSRATSADAMVEAIRHFTGPTMNIVFAHRDGTTGLMVAGRVPIRGPGHETMGRLPAVGAREVNDWQGYVPAALMPLVFNPQSGALVTANAKIVPDAYPYYQGLSFPPPFRQQRIQDLLDARDKHDLQSFRAIQLDVKSDATDRVLPYLRRLMPQSAELAEAVERLKSWDGGWNGDAAAPLIYATWMKELAQAVYSDELGDLFRQFWSYNPLLMEAVLSGELAEWCDDHGTEAIESCEHQLTESLTVAVRALKDVHGDNMEDWRWGAAAAETHRHLGLGSVPLLSGALSRTTSRSAAGPLVPNVSHVDLRQLPAAGNAHSGVSLRMIFDLADLEDARFITSSGQSGHFRSDHYDDLQKLWVKGDYIRIPTQESALGETREIVLRPAS